MIDQIKINRIYRILRDYKTIDWEALLRKDMGNYNLKEIKPALDKIKKYFDFIINNKDKINDFDSFYLKDDHNPFYESLLDFEKLQSSIIRHTDSDKNHILIYKVRELEKKLSRKLLPIFQYITTIQNIEIEKPLSEEKNKIEQKLKKLNVAVETANKLKSEIESQHSRITKEQETSRYGDFFKKEAWKNNILSWCFGGFLLGGSILAAFLALELPILKFDHEKIEANSSFVELLIKGDVINKFFVFSVILILISTIRREYFALRHQFTLDRQRQNSLSSHKEILNSIHKTANESDKEISNAILLEFTKAMVSPQDTGFLKNQSSSESKYSGNIKIPLQ